MTIVPGFAKDFVGRRRTVEMEVTPTSSILSKKASHVPGQVRWRIPFWGFQALPDMRYRSAAPSSHPAESPLSGKLSQRGRRGRYKFVEAAECGVVSRSSRGIPAPWGPLPEVHSAPLR